MQQKRKIDSFEEQTLLRLYNLVVSNDTKLIFTILCNPLQPYIIISHNTVSRIYIFENIKKKLLYAASVTLKVEFILSLINSNALKYNGVLNHTN